MTLRDNGKNFNIKTSSYQYSISHRKDKTVSWPSDLYNGNPITWKDGLCIETGPWSRSSKMTDFKTISEGHFDIMEHSMYTHQQSEFTFLLYVRWKFSLAFWQLIHVSGHGLREATPYRTWPECCDYNCNGAMFNAYMFLIMSANMPYYVIDYFRKHKKMRFFIYIIQRHSIPQVMGNHFQEKQEYSYFSVSWISWM